MLQHNRHDGRRGTINPTSSGCSVSIERAAIVISATMPYYADSSRSLPTTEAAGATPGWEDWDNDGHPAVSMRVSGLANGDRYCTTRTSAIWQGEAATDADYLKLRSDWRQDESVLGVTSDILKATGARDGDSSLHFVEFAKLSVGQVSGDDTTICKKIRELAPTLTPAATK